MCCADAEVSSNSTCPHVPRRVLERACAAGVGGSVHLRLGPVCSVEAAEVFLATEMLAKADAPTLPWHAFNLNPVLTPGIASV